MPVEAPQKQKTTEASSRSHGDSNACTMKCFMVYHYDENDHASNSIHDDAEDVFRRCLYECIRPDKSHIEGNFMEIVAAGIADADVVYVNIAADQANPNVFYELGIAHALNKWTIVVTEKNDLDNLPADIRGYNVLGYELGKRAEFKHTLERLLIDSSKSKEKAPKNNPISHIISEPSNEMLRTVFENVTSSAKHPLTAVLINFSPDKKPTSAIIDSISRKGNEFYGFEEDCTCLRGKTTAHLLEALKNWINDDDYKLLVADQERIARCISSDKTYIPPAKVPIRFNDQHPNPDYQNKSYYPVWIGAVHNRRKTESHCFSHQLASVLYIDLSMIPHPEQSGSTSGGGL